MAAWPHSKANSFFSIVGITLDIRLEEHCVAIDSDYHIFILTGSLGLVSGLVACLLIHPRFCASIVTALIQAINISNIFFMEWLLVVFEIFLIHYLLPTDGFDFPP